MDIVGGSYYKKLLTIELFKALEKENLGSIVQLIDKGADVNALNEDEMTPLMIASKKGNSSLVSLLLRAGANIKHIGGKAPKRTALMLAAENEHLLTMELLIQQGAGVNSTNDVQTTPLIVAAQAGKKKAVIFLLQKSANVHAENTNKTSALSAACMSGDIPTIEYLIKQHGGMRSLNSKNLFPAIAAGKIEVIQYLIQRGLSFEQTDFQNQPFINTALASNQPEMAKFLIKNKADLDCKNLNGQTPLMIAITKGYIELVKLLIQYGANIYEKDSKGMTAFLIALSLKQIEVIQILLQKGADIFAKSNGNLNAIMIAAYTGNIAILKLLIEKNQISLDEAESTKGATALIWACSQGNAEAVQLLIESGANLYCANQNGNLGLHSAIQGGHIGIVELQLKTDPNLIHYSNAQTHYPLFYAICANQLKIAKFLIKKGANVHTVDHNRSNATPLILACIKNNFEMVELLLCAGADITLKDSLNRNALDIAFAKKNKSICFRILCHMSLAERAAFAQQNNQTQQLVIDFEKALLENAHKLFDKIQPTWKINVDNIIEQQNPLLLPELFEHIKNLDAITQEFPNWYQHRVQLDLQKSIEFVFQKMKKPPVLLFSLEQTQNNKKRKGKEEREDNDKELKFKKMKLLN